MVFRLFIYWFEVSLRAGTWSVCYCLWSLRCVRSIRQCAHLWTVSGSSAVIQQRWFFWWQNILAVRSCHRMKWNSRRNLEWIFPIATKTFIQGKAFDAAWPGSTSASKRQIPSIPLHRNITNEPVVFLCLFGNEITCPNICLSQRIAAMNGSSIRWHSEELVQSNCAFFSSTFLVVWLRANESRVWPFSALWTVSLSTPPVGVDLREISGSVTLSLVECPH